MKGAFGMNYVKITSGYAIAERHIKSCAIYEGAKIINKIKALKEAGKVEDLTRGKKINTVLFLMNGEAIVTNVNYETILKRWDGSGK